jgi:hypothetical protein
MLIGIAINLRQPGSLNIFPFALALFACVCLRLIFALWLKRLGGVPDEFRPK